MTDEPFQLATDAEALVSTGALAAALGVSGQTVRNYRKAGMPAAGQNDRGPLFKVSECRVWVAQNTSPRVGGAREGAGRPRAGTEARPPGRHGGTKGRDLPIVAEAMSRKDELAEAKLSLLEGTGGTKELDLLAGLDEEAGGFTLKEADRIVRIKVAQLKQQELDENAGRLVAAAEVEQDRMQTFTRLRRDLEQLPETLAGQVLGALELDQSRLLKVRMVAAEAVERLIERMGSEWEARVAALGVA